MSNDIHIPPEAVEAAARTIATYRNGGDKWSTLFLRQSEDAVRAALAAWPGMHIHEWQRPWLGGMSGTDIILPLTEPRE